MPIERTIVDNVRGVIGAINRFIPQHRGNVEMSNGSNRLLVGKSWGYFRLV